MIRWISQIEGHNILEVEYSSGAKHYCRLGMYNNYIMTKTQENFINNSINVTVVISKFRKIKYYLDKKNPDPVILQRAKLKPQI